MNIDEFIGVLNEKDSSKCTNRYVSKVYNPKKSGMREVNRMWCNAIGRTLHHFAMSCSKSGTGSLQVFLGLLLMFLYLLVLVST